MSFDKIKFTCGVNVDQFIYASCLEFNGLYKIDIQNGNSKFIGHFPEEALTKDSLHRNAFRYEEKIVFVPSKASGIHVYDLKNESIHVVHICRENYQSGYVGEIINEKIFLVPEIYGGNIIEFDILTESVRLFVPWDKIKTYLNMDEKFHFLFVRITKLHDKLVLPICKTRKILLLNVQTAKFEEIVLDINEIFGCFAGRNRIWILGDFGKKIYSWNTDSGEIKEYLHDKSEYEIGRELNWIVECNDNVYAFPAQGQRVLILREKKFVELMFCEKNVDGYQKYFSPICIEKYVITLPCGTSNLLKICNDRVLKLKIDDMDHNLSLYRLLVLNYINKSKIELLQEGRGLSFKQFLDGVVQA